MYFLIKKEFQSINEQKFVMKLLKHVLKRETFFNGGIHYKIVKEKIF